MYLTGENKGNLIDKEVNLVVLGDQATTSIIIMPPDMIIFNVSNNSRK